MTDRYNSLTVALDRDIRDDDAEAIINAIKTMRGVSDVTGNVVDMDSYVAQSRVNLKIQQKMIEFFKELQEGK